MKKNFTKINWGEMGGLVPAIVQDAETSAVLMLGFMNREALKKTLSTKKVWFYSRTKKRLWMKGEESHHFLHVQDIFLDCDSDTILVKALPAGPTCHTGLVSCFGNEHGDIFARLFATILDRKKKMPKGSYTAELFSKGTKTMCNKIIEEAAEVIMAAKKESRKRLTEEAADLLYHLFVLIASRKISLADLKKELRRRAG